MTDASKLTGASLDAAVARAEGFTVDEAPTCGVRVDIRTGAAAYHEGVKLIHGGGATCFAPSTDWLHGGPIVERERIEISRSGSQWCAKVGTSNGAVGDGPTPLVAAMRAFVVSKQ